MKVYSKFLKVQIFTFNCISKWFKHLQNIEQHCQKLLGYTGSCEYVPNNLQFAAASSFPPLLSSWVQSRHAELVTISWCNYITNRKMLMKNNINRHVLPDFQVLLASLLRIRPSNYWWTDLFSHTDTHIPGTEHSSLSHPSIIFCNSYYHHLLIDTFFGIGTMLTIKKTKGNI